jgi:hypothetical protein
VALLGGAGGLSAAATDLARLIAILIGQSDNPGLERATISAMLSAAAMRGGYGFDGARDYGGDSFDGQWGFMLCFGSPAQVDGATPSWYPDFPAVMNVAKKTLTGAADLFPQFGMAPL